WHSSLYSAAPLPARVASIGGSMAGHAGDRRPENALAGNGGWPAKVVSIQSRLRGAIVESNNGRPGLLRLTSAFTPIASPALRTMGCMIEPLYCTQVNHGAVQIRGKCTGAVSGA